METINKLGCGCGISPVSNSHKKSIFSRQSSLQKRPNQFINNEFTGSEVAIFIADIIRDSNDNITNINKLNSKDFDILNSKELLELNYNRFGSIDLNKMFVLENSSNLNNRAIVASTQNAIMLCFWNHNRNFDVERSLIFFYGKGSILIQNFRGAIIGEITNDDIHSILGGTPTSRTPNAIWSGGLFKSCMGKFITNISDALYAATNPNWTTSVVAYCAWVANVA